MEQALTVALGYAFAVIIGHFLIGWVVDTMWRETGWDGTKYRDRPAFYQARLVGLIERILYVGSLQIGKPEFIGVWLAVKVAGQWKQWGEGSEVAGRQIQGRVFYNIFLMGSGLSIVYAATGAKIIEWAKEQKWTALVALPVLIVLLTLVLKWVVDFYQRKYPIPAHKPQANDGNSQEEDGQGR